MHAKDPNGGDVVTHGRFSYVYLGRVNTKEWVYKPVSPCTGFYDWKYYKNVQAWHGLGLTAHVADYSAFWAATMQRRLPRTHHWYCDFSIKNRSKIAIVAHVEIPLDYWERMREQASWGDGQRELARNVELLG